MSHYFKNIKNSVQTLTNGMKLTLGYMWDARNSRKQVGIANDNYFNQPDGIFTLNYPFEQLPVPEVGRYKLHNEIEDCIVCDKCAKICPVNCIDIEPIKATEEIGKTSDGTTKRIYAAKFDIDMAKCCFCGLCTTVCPTECLTMTNEYDFSVFDFVEHNFAFGNMTPEEIVLRKQQAEAAQQAKAMQNVEKPADVTSPASTDSTVANDTPSAPKPIFKPRPMLKPKTGGANE